MAINKIYHAEFTDLKGNDWRVDILKNPQGTITSKEFTLAEPGFSLSYQGAENIFSPIIPSTCTIPFIVHDSDAEDFVTDLFSMTEGQYIVEIIRDPDGTPVTHWRGFLTSDNLSIPDEVTPYVVDLQAVDGLQTLSRRDHPETGTHTFVEIFVDALATIPTTDRFTASEAFLKYASDYAPQGLTGYNGNALNSLKVAVTTTLTLQTLQQSETPTAEEMLIQALTLFNLRLFQREGCWAVVPATRVLNDNGTIPYYSANKTAGVATGGTFLLPKTIETGANKLVGNWDIQFLPPVRRVIRELNYLGNRPLGGVEFEGFTTPASITSQTAPVAPTTFGTDLETQFSAGTKFTFRSSINCEQGPSTTTTGSPLVRYRIEFKVKVGAYYLQRTHDIGNDETTITAENFNLGNQDQTMKRPKQPKSVKWTQSSSSRVEMIGDVLNSDLETNNFSDGVDSCDFTLSLQSPELPAATDCDIEVEVYAFGIGQDGTEVAAAIANEANIDADPQLFVGTGQDSDVLTLAAVASNSASEEVTIEPASVYGESGSIVETGFLEVYFGSIVAAGNEKPTGFQSSLTTTTELVNRLVCLDQLRHFQTPQEVRTGSVFYDGFLSPVNTLSFDSAKWQILNLTHEARTATFNVELVKVAQSSGPVADDGSDGVDFAKRSVLARRNVGRSQDSLRRELYQNTASLQADIETEVANRQALELEDLQNVSGTASTDDVLKYDGTAWRVVGQNLLTGVPDNSLSEADQSLGADREIDLNGNTLDIVDGSTSKLTISDANGVQVFGDFKVDSGAVAGSSLKLEEADLLGNHAVVLKAPISLNADVNLTFPLSNGSEGQALMLSDGFGQLEFGDIVEKLNPVVNNTLTIRPVSAGISNTQIYLKGKDDDAGLYIKAADDIATDVTFTLPDADGSDGDILTTDGSGVMAFEKPKSYHIIASSFYAADGNGDYIPIGGTLSETTSSNYYTIWTAPCAGRVVKATGIVSATTAGATTLTVRKYPIPQTFASASHTFSSTLTTGTFTFGASATFAAGDRLQFRFDPTGRPNGVQLSILLELTHE